MGTSPENTLTSFDLELLLGPPPTLLSEIHDHDYLVQNVEINGSTHHSLQRQNVETIDQGYHVQTDETTNKENKSQSVGNITPTEQNFHDQNIGNVGNTDYDYQVPNMGNESIYSNQGNNEVVNKSDYESLENHYKKLSADYLSLQNSYETMNIDYVAVKKQYAKLASDYASLHKENKEHAMQSLNISRKCENLEKKEVDNLARISSLNTEYQRCCLELSAQNKQFIQFQSYIEDLMTEIANLKNNVKAEKNLGKDSRKMISTLSNNNKTFTEHLCLLACVIEGRRQLDKDCQRLIKKYCKKTTSCKKSIIEAEIMENQSMDTGRGSSLAFSDGERSSFNSPAYSLPCSPFSIGISTPRYDHTKITRDSFTSPPPTIQTIDISTSPVVFEVDDISKPATKTSDAATNTVIYDETKTSVPKTRTVHIATSPIKFTNMWTPITKTGTIDTATSPIDFLETNLSVANTIDTAVSPIMFPVTRIPANKTTLDTLDAAVSPIMFADSRLPVANKTTLDTLDAAVSPIMFADSRLPVANKTTLDTLDAAVSPIMFADSRLPVVNKSTLDTLDAAVSPIMFADSRMPVANKSTLDTLDAAVSPIMFADSRLPVANKYTLDTLDAAVSPIMFADSRLPVANKTTLDTLDAAVSPIMFADSRLPVANKSTLDTLDAAVSPIMFADSRLPVANKSTLDTLDAAVSPIMFADSRLPVANKSTLDTLDAAVSPIMFADSRMPVANKSTLDTLDAAVSPIMFADSRMPVANKSTLDSLDAAVSPIMFADSRMPVANKTTLDTVVSPIMFADTEEPSVSKTRTFNTAASPITLGDISSRLVKTKALDIATSPVELTDKNTNTRDIADSPKIFADTRTPIVKTKSPVHYVDTETATAMVLTKSSKPEDKDSSVTYNSVKPPVAYAKSVELAGGIKHVNPRVLISSPSMLDTESANARNLLFKPKTLQVENRTDTRFLKPIAFVPSSCNTRHTEDFREKLNEIVSKQSNQSQDDGENDLEIKTILSKLTLDWGMLSPMSLTPEPEQKQSENKKKSFSTSMEKVCDQSYTLAQSLYLSSDDNSEDEIDREDCHISDLPVENPKHVETRRKTSSPDQNTCTSPIECIMAEPPDNKISNKAHVKSSKTTSKYQKVIPLQKNYKANSPKSKIKSPQKTILKLLKRQRSKLFTIPPIKSSKTVSLNEELCSTLAENVQDEKQDALVVGVCKESVKSSNKEAPQNLKQTQLNRLADPSTNTLDPPEPIERLCDSDPSTNTLDPPEPIERLCDSSETLTNNTFNFVTPHPPTNTSAEFNAKKIKSTLKETQSSISQSPTNMFAKCNTNKRVCIPSNGKSELTAQSNRLPQSNPNLKIPTDLNIETNYTYPKPTIKRLSRVKNAISVISSSVPTKQAENNQTNENISSLSETTTSNVFNENTKSESIPQQNSAKEKTIKKNREITNGGVQNNKNYSGDVQNSGISHTLNKNNSSPTLLKKPVNRQSRHFADYSDLNMFDNQNVCESVETSEITKQTATECTPIQNNKNTDSTVIAKALNLQTKHADNSDTHMLDAQNVCNNKDTSKISEQSVREGILNQDNNNIDSAILAKSTNHETRHYADYSDTNMFDSQNIKNKEKSEITKQSFRECILNQDNTNTVSTILAKTSNHRKRRRADDSGNVNVKVCESENYDKNGIPESWNQNILDRMIYMYGHMGRRHKTQKCGDEVVTIFIKGIKKCVSRMPKPEEYTASLQQLVDELKPHGTEQICYGLMDYLKDPARKPEFVSTNRNRNGYYVGPSASQTEMALIDVIELLYKSGIDIWDLVLDISEFILFTLERESTPCFDVVESVSHFFVNFCKYRGDVSRLWMFMLNAMYCLSFKAIPVIKNCLDIVPRLIPYAGAYIVPAQAPLIRCFVFLLNFYACDDRLKRVDEIRRRLKFDYHYNLQEENETTLLFMLKTSILRLADQKVDKDMLELSFLIVAKRRGTKWSHKNIVHKILLPMIKGEIEVSYTAKRFCITTIGCIMKPYNNDMTVHTEEVVNLLINMFKEESQSNEIKEDIIRSLINMDIRSLWHRINACLSTWTPSTTASPEFHRALQLYVQGKPLQNWRTWHRYYVEET